MLQRQVLGRWVNDLQTQVLLVWVEVTVAVQQLNIVFDAICSKKTIHCFTDGNAGFSELPVIPGSSDCQVRIQHADLAKPQ